MQWLDHLLDRVLEFFGIGEVEATDRRDKTDLQTTKSAFLIRPPRSTVIFLDFDGVLHPGYSGTFVHIPLLEDFLRKYPSVDIIVSSSWRLDTSYEAIVAKFSEDIRCRIIGITGEVRSETYSRFREISDVCQKYRITKWAILDDEAKYFPSDCQQLILTERMQGINRDIISILERQLGQ